MNIGAAIRAAVQAMDAHKPTPAPASIVTAVPVHVAEAVPSAGNVVAPSTYNPVIGVDPFSSGAAQQAVLRAQEWAAQQAAWRAANPNPVATLVPLATGVNQNIATNEPRLVRVNRSRSIQQALKRIPVKGGRLYGLGQEEEDYQAPIPEPEIDLIPVKQYDVRTGGRYQPLGEINSTLATVVGYGVLGLIVWGLMKGVRTR